MRMLAQALEWEDRLARNMLPGDVLTESLQSILGDAVERTVSTGHKLAAGRADRDQIFPLLDMIVCMHDPYVLPSMKKAFRSQTMSHLKSRFLELLTELCSACESCIKAFTASLAGEALPIAKDGGAQTTIAAQTAFAMRVLKVWTRAMLHSLATMQPSSGAPADTAVCERRAPGRARCVCEWRVTAESQAPRARASSLQTARRCVQPAAHSPNPASKACRTSFARTCKASSLF